MGYPRLPSPRVSMCSLSFFIVLLACAGQSWEIWWEGKRDAASEGLYNRGIGVGGLLKRGFGFEHRYVTSPIACMPYVLGWKAIARIDRFARKRGGVRHSIYGNHYSLSWLSTVWILASEIDDEVFSLSLSLYILTACESGRQLHHLLWWKPEDANCYHPTWKVCCAYAWVPPRSIFRGWTDLWWWCLLAFARPSADKLNYDNGTC